MIVGDGWTGMMYDITNDDGWMDGCVVDFFFHCLNPWEYGVFGVLSR